MITSEIKGKNGIDFTVILCQKAEIAKIPDYVPSDHFYVLEQEIDYLIIALLKMKNANT
jgi:hypothetical protein